MNSDDTRELVRQVASLKGRIKHLANFLYLHYRVPVGDALLPALNGCGVLVYELYVAVGVERLQLDYKEDPADRIKSFEECRKEFYLVRRVLTDLVACMNRKLALRRSPVRRYANRIIRALDATVHKMDNPGYLRKKKPLWTS